MADEMFSSQIPNPKLESYNPYKVKTFLILTSMAIKSFHLKIFGHCYAKPTTHGNSTQQLFFVRSFAMLWKFSIFLFKIQWHIEIF